jgi:hypothetical protein
MIHEGQEVQVVDHETGEDLTNLTLSQIIFEQEKKGSGLLPRALLTNLVRAGGDTLEQVRRALMGGAAGEAADKTLAAENHADNSPLHKVDDLFQDLLTSLNVPTNRDLQRLQGQVDELNRKIAELLAAEQAGAALAGSAQTSGAQASKAKSTRSRKQSSSQSSDQSGPHENG